jgi:hypothetical protein
VSTISGLQIQLWPEYDRAAMLVQYSGQVDGEGETPLTFTLPETATLHVTAYLDPENGLVELPNELNGNQVTLTTPNGSFHVEYYDALDTSSAQREYTLTWAGDYAVTVLQWNVQIPPTATDVSITPQARGPVLGADGLNYYSVQQESLEQDSDSTITVKYQKANDTLTAPPGGETSGGTETDTGASDTSSTTGGISTTAVIITVLAIVGLGALGGGLYLYNRNRDAEEKVPLHKAAAPKPKRAASSSKAASTPGAAKYCTQCGTPAADASDKFCRKCGAALR